MNREQALAILASTTSTAEQVAEARKVLAATTPAPTTTATAVLDDPEIKAAREQAKKDADEIKAARAKIELESKVSAATKALDGRLTIAKLPHGAEKLVRASFSTRIAAGETIPETEIDAAVTDARAAVGAPIAAGASGVAVGAGAQDKIALCLERMLLGNAPQYAKDRFSRLWAGANGESLEKREQAAGIGYRDRAYSFRETFRAFNGFDITELWNNATNRAQMTKLRASINIAQWGDVFENVLNVAGVAYQESPRYSNWRKIVKIVPLSSIKKQERVTTGGYANLPIVAEGGNYTAATSPGDTGHGYTPAKRGMTEDWTKEAMIEDNIGKLAEIIQKMALAADRTVNDYVFDQLTILGMPTMDYDSVALFHSSSHGANLNTSALTATSLAASRLTMLKQTDQSSSKRMSITPKFLLVRDDLYQTAYDLVLAQLPPGGTTQYDFIRSWMLEIIPVTPTTNGWDTVADWVLAADPNNGQVATFEMGFLNGRETAEIFVQDAPNVGSVFERDAVTVAVKQAHFGGAPLRHEGFFINDV